MELLNIIAGIASIVSLFVSIISLTKVNAIQKEINESKQNIENTTVSGKSTIMQIGRDNLK